MVMVVVVRRIGVTAISRPAGSVTGHVRIRNIDPRSVGITHRSAVMMTMVVTASGYSRVSKTSCERGDRQGNQDSLPMIYHG